ncbi:hypothetical protein EV426DRAFT_276893 [Tirmania nivea]|nr:hypothetical protein EV426DRAFT_276893 [Tirmania nivea]
MVSRIINMYRVLATTFTNGYRNGVWRVVPIVPQNNTTTEHRKKPNSPVRILPRSLVTRTEYGLNRLHRGVDMRRVRNHEHQTAIMASKTGYAQSMAKPLVRVDQFGIVPRWKKETLLGAEVFIKADTLEMTPFKKIYEAAIPRYLPPHLTPRATSAITSHLRYFKPKEYLYICRSMAGTSDGKSWYKIGRSTNVAQRMKKHKSCNLELVLVIEVHNSTKVEELIHAEIKDNADVCHGLKMCPFCGTGHREMFSMPTGQEGVKLLRKVVNRWVNWDEWVHRVAQQHSVKGKGNRLD